MSIDKFARACLRLLAAVLLFAFAGHRTANAQDQGAGKIRVNVNLVLVDATVKSKGGQIMSTLKKEDFEVREDGVAQNVEVFSRDDLPVNVALVLDLSDSIEPFLMPLRDAAKIALAALKPDDEVSLFTFATEAQMREPLTKDKNKIADRINTFEARGATNINDGIFSAAGSICSSSRPMAAA